ncbi:DIA2 Protein DIA2 [Candida maltosa Xu316]
MIVNSMYNLQESAVVGPTNHPKLGSLIDQRAATYEKLGQNASALKDGKELIKLEPISCKGYLRTGKLLSGMNKKVEAYKCYQEGLYIIEKAVKDYGVSVPEKLFSTLKSQYRLLNSELKRKRKVEADGQTQTVKKVKRTTDPFVYLPIDVMELVFSGIPMNQVLQYHSVCKLWYYSLTSIPRLYNFRCKPSITLNEFIAGAKLFKKIGMNTFSKSIQQVKINQVATKQHLLKVVEILIREPGLSAKNLDLIDKHFNLQLFYHLLGKFGWKFTNFRNLQSLRLGINCSIKYGQALLNMFSNLKFLEIVVILPEKSSLDLIPIQDRIFKKLKDSEKDEYSLERLLLVNHPKLLNDNPSMISPQTYNPYPILLDKCFPQLTELTLVSFDFSTTLPQFGDFLTRVPKLEKLFLENNNSINMLIFLQMILNYRPSFRLKEFTFRESSVTTPTSLTEFRITDLQQFKTITKLDLYKNCLSVTGFLKLLKICGKSVKNLNIGQSNYISFTLHSERMIYLSDILKKCPHLNTLGLSDMNIDQQAMIQLNRDFSQLQNNIQVLDLSFNKIDGISLLQMFEKTLNVNSVDVIMIHGMEVSNDTIQYLTRKKYVKNVVFDKSRVKWQVFGVNSWVQ